ncbi:MAG: hypothetical protein JSV86_01750 [Gemmatimonadota bacterium]|nr:MAG: hypothetical protein JSV86_01750 [Gemmatimonadota bacterium]
MMTVAYLVALFFLAILAKIVLVDSPLGKALGDAVSNLVPPKASEGAVSRGELDKLRHDVEELRDRVERVVEEQTFLTQLLSEPGHMRLGPGEAEDSDTRT